MTRAARIELAKTRLIRVVGAHGVALARTLEQKLAVAGPYNQRVNPHIITEARNQLHDMGELTSLSNANVRWYYLPGTPDAYIAERLAEQEPVHLAVTQDGFTKRLGQTLEITVQRALDHNPEITYFGRYIDLSEHDDSTLYKKEEPPSHLSGRSLLGKQKLDFIINASSQWAGIEIKNTRPWIYPQQDELLELLRKCCALEIVPVLIARRIPYVTGHLFRRCGLIVWETLRQRYPASEAALAELARHKRLLGYSDITLGNEPDGPLLKFITMNLPKVLPEARVRFDTYKDLLSAYAYGDMSYVEFAARVRRRSEGRNEDSDEPDGIDEWLDPPW